MSATEPTTGREGDDAIIIRGAREHNLKNVTVTIPKHKLVVFTGVSGSGKSSLAFDTLYAEGQRRYVESLSSYARQFLGQMEKPKYDSIKGLSPTIAIEQKAASNNPRSTVGTVTEVYDYLRVLWARFSTPHCPQCYDPVAGQSQARIVEILASYPEGTKLSLFAPLVQNRKGEHKAELESAKERGFHRVRIDGRLVDLTEETPRLDKKTKHDLDLLIDRIVVKAIELPRLTESVESALREGNGLLRAVFPGKGDAEEERLFSTARACLRCGISFEEPTPNHFSFNSPAGACTGCNGLGTRPEMDRDLLVPDGSKSIAEGAVVPWAAAMGRGEGMKADWLTAVLRALGVRADVPWNTIPAEKREALLGGATVGRFVWEGLAPQLLRRLEETKSEEMRQYYLKYFSDKPCPECAGTRLKPESRVARIGAATLPVLCKLPVAEAFRWAEELPLPEQDRVVVEELRKEISNRLGFLVDVGLGYLTLARASGSLSGGESQRIRLASQIGSELTGVVYVLDEPSIGLHQRDNERLLRTLLRLRDLGNTVVVVEHDDDTIRAADYLCDFGPGAGARGGELVAAGTPAEVFAHPTSLTAAFHSGRRTIAVPEVRRRGSGESLRIVGAAEHNLKGVTVDFPLHTFIGVTGVSGAGKSTLVNRILLPTLQRTLHDSRVTIGRCERVESVRDGEGVLRSGVSPGGDKRIGPVTALIDKVVAIDQQPIGRTPRSNPATYTKIFDGIRELFSQLPESRARGWTASRFSFNVKGGSCDACGGDGLRRVEMHFLPDVFVPCDTCKGKRFNEATLRVTFKGKTIADVLAMSVGEALELFANHRDILRGLKTLDDVGLSYLPLGQPSTTLSGGEAQRIKLARELAKVGTGRTVYVLDEPTTGLHVADIERLLTVLQRLVEAGNTVIVIEHNLDVIKCADHLIDLGPDGGDAGGTILALGTPEEVAGNPSSSTGHFLRAFVTPLEVAARPQETPAVKGKRVGKAKGSGAR